MNKHTPTPWNWMYWENDGQVVYNVKPVMRPIDGQIENKADARLIAASPDLLFALERCVEMLKTIGGYDNQYYAPIVIEIGEKAILKALSGESSI